MIHALYSNEEHPPILQAILQILTYLDALQICYHNKLTHRRLPYWTMVVAAIESINKLNL